MKDHGRDTSNTGAVSKLISTMYNTLLESAYE
jgi:hypothetical protein